MRAAVDTFGQIIKRARKNKCISQTKLADMIKVNSTYISKLENGTIKPPSQQIISELARALEIDVHELLIAAKIIPSDYMRIISEDKTVRLLLKKHADLSEGQKREIHSILESDY